MGEIEKMMAEVLPLLYSDDPSIREVAKERVLELGRSADKTSALLLEASKLISELTEAVCV